MWKYRHLLVTRPEHLDGRQRLRPSRMFCYLPASRMLREFVLAIYRLFDPDQSSHQSRCRRAALGKDTRYQADPDLSKALGVLAREKFDRMITFLQSPVAERVRTNNHVERTNRRLRHFEKVRYKWRRRRTIVRFLVLALDRLRVQRIARVLDGPGTDREPQSWRPCHQAD